MIKLIPLKFFSAVLVVALLILTIGGAYEAAHAKSLLSAASDQVAQSDLFDSNQCPICPPEHKDCDVCINCVCHSFLTIQQFQLSYNPPIFNIAASEPFKHLPEVYLSKFIPPQKHA